MFLTLVNCHTIILAKASHDRYAL